MSSYQQLSDHYLDLYAQALRLLKDPDDAKDAVQEAITITLGRLVPVSDPYAFCFKTLRNCCIDMIRRRNRLTSVAECVAVEGSCGSGIPQLLLDQIKSMLSAEEMAFVVMHDVEGYTLDEIAAMSGSKRWKIRETIEKIHESLKKELI